MHNPIKELRLHLGLTQTEFANQIGSRQTTVAGWERDSHTPNESVIMLIAGTFHANPEFLRTGEGPMMQDVSPDQIFGEKVGKLLALPDGDPHRQAMEALIDLPPEALPTVLEFLKFLQHLK